MALDKPIQRRKYYTIIDYTPKNLDKIDDENIFFDSDWLSIVKTFNEYFPTNSSNYDFSEFIKNVIKILFDVYFRKMIIGTF